jgi:hypothetical protein
MHLLLNRPDKPRSSSRSVTTEPPQLHSLDYFARLPAWSIFEAEWLHLDTNLDDHAIDVDPALRYSDDVIFSGSTEWQAKHHGHTLSLGWDWIAAEDGTVYTCAVTLPRTNVMVVDGGGYDAGEIATAIVLWKNVDLLPWRITVKNLLGRSGFKPLRLH